MTSTKKTYNSFNDENPPTAILFIHTVNCIPLVVKQINNIDQKCLRPDPKSNYLLGKHNFISI
uniref:Uncharacterized protein n=1 Tax=Anguilla anguilla TaxID=7936 RepID=A0A0E9WY54_ANGAN